MIRSFADETTRDIYHGANTKAARRLRTDLWAVAFRKLDMLNAATTLADLKSPPGNRLEALGADRKGQWSIRINEQYRVAFRFDANGASDVEITDYH